MSLDPADDEADAVDEHGGGDGHDAARTDLLAKLVGLLASSGDIEELADHVLDGLRTLIGAPHAGFYLLDRGCRGTVFTRSRGVSEFFLALYEEIGRQHDPLLEHVLTERTAIDNVALMPMERWRTSQVYRDVLGLHRMDHVLEIPLVVDGDVIGTMNLAGSQRPRLPDELLLATAIGRLIGESVRALQERSDAGRERRQLLFAFDLVADGVVLTDLKCRQRSVNRAGQRILETIQGPGAVLDELLAQAPPSGGEVAVVDVALIGGGRGQVEISTMATPDDPTLVVTRLALRGAVRRLPLHVRDRLSPREQQVVERVARGLPDREVATQLSVSVHTVRDHLKSAYRKLGVHARIDLVHLLGS